ARESAAEAPDCSPCSSVSSVFQRPRGWSAHRPHCTRPAAPMPILPIAQFEADLAEQDRQTYERLKAPSSVVVKFGSMGLIGEFPYGLEDKPGCGTKFVLKTHRGTELGEMLTSTCPNSGCGKSISRKEM